MKSLKNKIRTSQRGFSVWVLFLVLGVLLIGAWRFSEYKKEQRTALKNTQETALTEQRQSQADQERKALEQRKAEELAQQDTQFSSWTFSSYQAPSGKFYCSVISAVANKNVGQNIAIKGSPSSKQLELVIDLYKDKWNRKQGSTVNVIFDFLISNNLQPSSPGELVRA